LSKLFNWLKKTEGEKGNGPTKVAPGTVDLHVPDLEPIQLDPVMPEPGLAQPGPAASAPSNPTFARLEMDNPLRFDLKMADWRVRTVLDHRSVVGEQYRFLRNKLSQMKRQHGIKTILVTSSVPVEGKTFTACCLAGILAQEPGKRVLLVDADLHKPHAAQNLGMDGLGGLGGLAHVLAGKIPVQETLLRCSNLDFFFLPAGPVPQNPSQLLSSPATDRVVKQMSELFDWVIIDCPPVLVLADAARLAPLCDTVLLVVQANKTSSKLVQQAIQMIGRDHIGGVILNRVPLAKSYPYQYYHQYGEEGKKQPVR
jgi:capsular exopolysaccharide synthesis family protein